MKMFDASQKKISKILKLSLIKRRGRTSFLLKLFTVVTIITSFIGLAAGATMLVTDSHVKRSVFKDSYINEVIEFEETITEDAIINLDADFSVRIITTEGNEIKLINKYDRNSTMKYKVEVEKDNTYNINIESNSTWIESFKIDREVIELHIPNTIETLAIESSNVSVDLENIEVGNLIITGSNTNVDLENINYETIEIDLSNANIDMEGLSPKDDYENSNIEISVSNGNIDLENINSKSIVIDINNGNIDFEEINEKNKIENSMLLIYIRTGNIDLDDVYFKDVLIEMLIGNIDYENSDKTYSVNEDITISTGNKDIEIG